MERYAPAKETVRSDPGANRHGGARVRLFEHGRPKRRDDFLQIRLPDCTPSPGGADPFETTICVCISAYGRHSRPSVAPRYKPCLLVRLGMICRTVTA